MACFLIFGFKYDSIDINADPNCHYCTKGIDFIFIQEICILTITCLVRISVSICFGI